MATNYPLEVASVVRTKTFAIESHLAVARSEEGDSPLKTYKKLSRYVIGLINEKRENVIANIPVHEIAGIIQKSYYASNKHMDAELIPVEENLSPAYKVKITAGTFKGKTPAEILLENPENADGLNKQYKWLSSNLSKYPKNKEQMDAICDAAALLKSGSLNTKSVSKSQIELYRADMRPLQSKKREDGLWFVYAVSIRWNLGDAYPVEISVENYYAPVEKDPDKGTLNVKIRERDQSSVRKVNMLLTANEWMDAIRAIKSNMRQFEMLHAKEVYSDAVAVDANNRKTAGK